VIVFAQCLLEKGLVIQRQHIVRQHRMVVGSFSLADAFDDEMMRTTRVARLVMADTYDSRHQTPREIGSELFPKLLEATLIHWHDRVFTITGFERLDGTLMRECSYRQSWMLRIPTSAELDEIKHGRPSRQPA
jgi:hypothetical protein